MKKLNAKLGVLGILSATMLAGAALLINPVNTTGASAAETLPAEATDVFVMNETASIRLDESFNGIRFKVKMSADKYTEITESEKVTLGFLVFPNQLLGEITADYVTALPDKVEQEVLNEEKIKLEDDGYYYASVALVDVKPENFGVEFSSIAYIKTTAEEAEDSYEYATFNREFKRSINYVAEREIIEGGKIEQTQAAYPHVGADAGVENAYPVSINDAEDYALIAENVAKGISYENVSFIVRNDFDLAVGFTSIGEGFLGEIDGNGKTVTTTTDGAPVFFTADSTKVTNLTFNAMASAVLTVKDASAVSRIYDLNDGGKTYEHTVSYVEAGSEELAALDVSSVSGRSYTGNAIKIEKGAQASLSFKLAFNGTIPENADYVSFWLATGDWTLGGTITAPAYMYLDSGSIFYTKNAGTLHIASNYGNCLNLGGKTVDAKQKWYNFYCPVDLFKKNLTTMEGELKFSYYSPAAEGVPLYIGDISFVENTWDGAVDTIFPAYTKEYRTDTDIVGEETVEYVNLLSLPTVQTNAQMTTDGFTMNGYTGNAYKVISQHSGWAHDVKVDVSAISVADLQAKADSGITHLQVNIAWNVTVGTSFWYLQPDHWLDANILPLIKGADVGTVDNATNQQFKNTASMNNVWQTYDIAIADFIAAVTAAQAQTKAYYKNQVFLLCGYGGSAATADIYLGDMKFITK